jgi:phage shock protein C
MKRLYRSRDDKAIAGICGGIGQTWNVDPNIIRIVTVLAAVLTGILPVFIAYLIAWAILPLSPEELSKARAMPTGEAEPHRAAPPAESARPHDGPPPGAHPREI